MPFGADVLINGIWCHPDSDYARRYGYNQKTKTVNVQKGVEYLEKSKPVSKAPLAQKIRREVDEEIKKVKSYGDDNWAPSYRKGYEASVQYWAKHATRPSAAKKRSVSKKRKTPRTKKKSPRASLWTPGRKLAQKKCARGSFRTVKPNAKTLIVLCCPPGKWMPRKKKCKVSLRPHLKRVPRKRR